MHDLERFERVVALSRLSRKHHAVRSVQDLEIQILFRPILPLCFEHRTNDIVAVSIILKISDIPVFSRLFL